ncbi:MAG TPA: encapsulin-associated ferritin-like protein [Dongiaceae bacterium]|jgi:ferritin-like protein|nr:encapsulin-associated ferritin-like protein [Dongiaceae bacterium]
MASASATLHEGNLKPLTIDQHRALVSIQEELEAVDWYNQRAEGATDDALRAILEHNRDEEKEHAMMVLEWLRRHDPKLDAHMRTYLFTEGSILEVEEAATAAEATGGSPSGGGGGAAPGDQSLGIGSLHGTGSLDVKEA